jgi:hypothetical protein
VVSPEERANRIRMFEIRREERRQHEMRMAMAILVANARKEPAVGQVPIFAKFSPKKIGHWPKNGQKMAQKWRKF